MAVESSSSSPRDLGSMANEMAGSAQLHARENDGRALVAQRVTRQGVLQLRHRADIARVDLRHGGLDLPLRHADVGEALGGPAIEVGKVGFVLENAGIDFEVAHPAGKGVRNGFEHVGRNRPGVADRALDGLASLLV